MKQIKNDILFCLFLLLAVNTIVHAQQESQYTQYMYNTVVLNPAYAGSREKLSVTTLYRAQWIGLDGAPTTISAAVDTPLGKGLGLGATVVHDKIGPSDETNIAANFSYHIALDPTYRLYFGLRASANLLNVDFSRLTLESSADPQFKNNIENKFSPNVGAGLFIQSDDSYIGASVPNMLQTSYYENSQVAVVQKRQHLYIMGGYVFDLSYNLKLKPAALVKVVSSSPTQIDISANFLYNEKFTLGIGYRWGTALTGQAAFQVTDKILIGYAYDQNTGNLGQYTSGSHEFFLRFDLVNYGKGNKFTSRFF